MTPAANAGMRSLRTFRTMNPTIPETVRLAANFMEPSSGIGPLRRPRRDADS